MLFEVRDDRHLPVDARSENTALNYVAGHRHRLSEPEIRVDRATDEEVLALLGVCRSARDRFIVMAMSRAGFAARRGVAGCDARTCISSLMLEIFQAQKAGELPIEPGNIARFLATRELAAQFATAIAGLAPALHSGCHTRRLVAQLRAPSHVGTPQG